jgi:hypothetical protein
MAYRDELDAARARALALEEKLADREAEIAALRRAQARRVVGHVGPSAGGALGRQIVAGTLLLSFFTSGYLLVTREPRGMPRKRVAPPMERTGTSERSGLARGEVLRAPALDARGRDARGRDPRGEGPRSRRGEACSSDAARASASCAAVGVDAPQLEPMP